MTDDHRDLARDWGKATVTACAILLVGGMVSAARFVPSGSRPAALIVQFDKAPDSALAGEGGASENPSVPQDQATLTFAQWAIREGGAFAVILVILFFYRRDWKTATEFWRDQHAVTTQALRDSTKAQADMASALRENTQVVHHAKSVMQEYLPSRWADRAQQT
jgi:hypothetical protein